MHLWGSGSLSDSLCFPDTGPPAAGQSSAGDRRWHTPQTPVLGGSPTHLGGTGGAGEGAEEIELDLRKRFGYSSDVQCLPANLVVLRVQIPPPSVLQDLTTGLGVAGLHLVLLPLTPAAGVLGWGAGAGARPDGAAAPAAPVTPGPGAPAGPAPVHCSTHTHS